VSAIKFSPGGGNMAVVSGRGHVSLWELNLSGQGISKVGHWCEGLDLKPCGSGQDLLVVYKTYMGGARSARSCGFRSYEGGTRLLVIKVMWVGLMGGRG